MQRPEFAPTEFFARQDAARIRTGRLVIWFGLAVAGTVLGVYGAALLAFGAGAAKLHAHVNNTLWRPELFFGCLGVTLLIVGGASLFKSMELSGGGGKVAESVGGRRIESDTTDPDERKLLNIVEEMSLASGVPVPEVYLLDDEPGINAFAAGDSIEHAAVAVTRGALDKLSREELQAVMGHEFSHILNGDMRLNVRLIGWIFGLMAITVVGRVLLEFSPRSRSSRDKDNSGAALALFGLLVVVIGYIGYFFAQMIQASISRQREHLADASATQFTRNPEALANALRRIAGESYGTRLLNPHATEVAHMCFGEGVSSMFATHPPLEERIRLLKTDWDGTTLPPLDPERARLAARSEDEVNREFRERYVQHPGVLSDGAAHPAPASAPAIPPGLASLVRDPLGAQSAVLLLMMTDNPSANNEQAVALKSAVAPKLFGKLKSAWGVASGVAPQERLAVVQLAAPVLRRLNKEEADALLGNLRTLAQTDGKVSFYEIALIRLVASITTPADDRAEERSVAVLRPALRLVLGALMHASGHPDDTTALGRAMSLAPAFGDIADLPAPGELTLDALENAFATLATADFPRRRQILAAADALVRHDGVVNSDETDLLHALAAALRCPTV